MMIWQCLNYGITFTGISRTSLFKPCLLYTSTSPSGHTFSLNSLYYTKDGQPWYPVMGEIHYARIPQTDWEESILKMKASGVTVIATYVFWNMHEEVENVYTWDGNSNLRHFLKLCRKHGMYTWLRIGPWCHGEIRNGGFPDWLMPVSYTHLDVYKRQIYYWSEYIC